MRTSIVVASMIFISAQAFAQGGKPVARDAAGPASGTETETAGRPAPRAAVTPTPQPTAQPTAQPAPRPAAQPTVPPKQQPKNYIIRLREISERIAELKEQVSQTKYRLNLLKEAVLHGTIAGCQLLVVLDHRMSSSFRLTSVRFALDGKPVFSRQDIVDAKEATRRHWPIFTGPVPPGPHVLTVELRWRGYGHKLFSYVRGYRFKVLSSFSFKAAEGTETQVRVVAYEKGNRITTPLKDRPAIKFKAKVRGLADQKTTKRAR